MAEPSIVNASPLIYLSLAGLLDLLLEAGSTVLVPAAVLGEIRQRGPTDPTVRALATLEWLVEVPDPAIPPVIQSWDLGPGESTVLSYALSHPSTTTLIDDLAARRCATTLGIPVLGTLGLALKAKRSGRIPAARPILARLQVAGMYLAEDIRDAALALVGE